MVTKVNARYPDYVEKERKNYSLYVLQVRALISICDGLKGSGRRVMWCARDGKKVKSATLAGSTMPIHPHSPPESVINTLTGKYVNNIPLLTGEGAFGTLLNPTHYGAARYTSVKMSDFSKDVLMADIDLIPMMDNYDNTQLEPKYFLPIVPLALVNPSEGIAIGFKSNIFPRSLNYIIDSQISYLQNTPLKKKDFVYFTSTKSKGKRDGNTPDGNIRWGFSGDFEWISTSEIRITKLPQGESHERYQRMLIDLVSREEIEDYIDNSTDKIDITVKGKKGSFNRDDVEGIVKRLNLYQTYTEILNVIDFDGERIVNYTAEELIKDFTTWRLTWYKKRYERLLMLLQKEIQRYLDVLIAIDKNVNTVSKSTKNKKELVDILVKLGIVNTDYISELPVYRFTKEQKELVERQLKEARVKEKLYQSLIKSEPKRKEIYIQELQQIKQKYGD